jgi:hypothetical protein
VPQVVNLRRSFNRLLQTTAQPSQAARRVLIRCRRRGKQKLVVNCHKLSSVARGSSAACFTSGTTTGLPVLNLSAGIDHDARKVDLAPLHAFDVAEAGAGVERQLEQVAHVLRYRFEPLVKARQLFGQQIPLALVFGKAIDAGRGVDGAPRSRARL